MPVTERALEMAMTAAQAAADKKAQDIVVIDVAD
ncbi:MAG TPA: ribosome silencing factor, partial [Actinoplanes sp.]|nr:ribosome silencing factor [Actinoplanes sp.]